MVLTLCNKVYLCYVTHFNMHELETIVFCHSGSNPGHFRRQTTPSAMANYCLVLLSYPAGVAGQGLVSESFLSASSSSYTADAIGCVLFRSRSFCQPLLKSAKSM